MTKEEYKSKMKELENEFRKKKSILYREYAESNNPYKVGDIIEDHLGKGQIISWETCMLFAQDFPCLSYKCHNLLKNGNISKKEPMRYIYQNNIKRNEKENSI